MRPNRPFVRPAPVLALALLLALGLELALPARAPGQTSAQAASPAASPAGVQVGLEGARLVDFIRFLGQFLGGAPVLREDQIPPVDVSVVAPEPMAEGELGELLELVLRPAGLEAVRRGGVPYVLPAPSAGQLSPGGPRHHLPPHTQILAWRLPALASPGRAQAVAGVLESLRSDRGRVLSSGRLIVLADEAPRVARLRPVLQALSALPPDHSPEIVPLVRAQARQAARALEMQTRGAALTVLPLEWSNSLLLAGAPEALARARSLLAQADGAGPEAPVLKAYRTRHMRPDKLLEALREKLGAGTEAPPAEAPRLSLDQDGQAVLALASPEALARLDRLVEDLDQPRPRVYIEALVAEFTPEALALLALTGEPPADRNGPGAADGFRVGSALVLRGRAVDAAQLGMEGLAALWSREPGVRVLSVPRLAVLEGAEARVSGGQFGAEAPGQADAERFRLTLSPRLEPGQAGVAGRVLLRVGLAEGQADGQANGQDAGRSKNFEATLSEGQVLLVGGPAREAQAGAGWSVFAAPRRDEGPGRLVVVASARVVRPVAPDRGVGPASSAGPAGRTTGEPGGRGARDKN